MSVRVERPATYVAEIVMDRPEARNALSTAQAEALVAACAEVAADDSIVVVVLTGAGPAFCAGADLKERGGFGTAEFRGQRPVLAAAFAAVRDLEMPTIAAVDGYALGGGCELALSCDLIVAGGGAVFGLPEVGLGLIPGGGGTQLLPRRIGSGRAADLILTGRHVPADEAYALGLADRLVPAGTALTAALELAETIAQRSPSALRAAKFALVNGVGRPMVEALQVEGSAWDDAVASPDRVEGIAAFVERRPPRWPSRA